MHAREVNFDGIVGLTHNFAGLSPGNIASERHGGQRSSPRQAALQGLAKAKRLADLGLEQHVLPPHERPNVEILRSLGFSGDDAAVLGAAAREAPDLLAIASSASAMWAANAATVSPSVDSSDGRLHLSPANLAFNAHRGFEAGFVTRALRRVFADASRFAVHDPLPATPIYFDEGAANHTRLAPSHGDPGLQVYCYGRPASARSDLQVGTTRFPARQNEKASRAIARRHGVDVDRAVFVQQNPEAIDGGIFHNDVISVGNENVLLLHELAYAHHDKAIDAIRAAYPGDELHVFTVRADELDLDEVAQTYLFNSQLVTVEAADGGRSMLLIAPSDVERSARASACVERFIEEVGPVGGVMYVDVRESMKNGGGPACLRLRVVMTADERAALGGRTRLDDGLYVDLVGWVERHYRDELSFADLADPALLDESRTALDELSRLLDLGSIYGFQSEASVSEPARSLD
ncbi:MAG: N-succinylarginine dihydrolase [Phycisphaerae bacterium]|nr:N-succinylarginine dihydrolase [Phycisphaerae bacterium]